MRDIFISYVEENSDLATTIAAGLEKEGFSSWYYERDSIPGPSYLLQTAREIEAAKAVVVIISPHSLSSHQVTKEVIRGHESGKPFIPVLSEITHVEFGTRQPEWREAIGSATSISVPSAGVAAIVPRILQGVRGLGIQPTGTEGLEAPQITPPLASLTPPPAPRSVALAQLTSLWPKLAVGLVVLLVLGFGGASLLSADEPARDTTAASDVPSTTESEVPLLEEQFPLEGEFTEENPTGEELVDSFPDEFKSAAKTPIKTSAGKFRVEAAQLTKEACPPPTVPGDCYRGTGTDRYLVLTLVPDGGGTAGLTQVFTNEGHQSSLTFGAGLQAGTYSISLDTSTNKIRIIYGIISASAAKEDVFLYWPKNPALLLPMITAG